MKKLLVICLFFLSVAAIAQGISTPSQKKAIDWRSGVLNNPASDEREILKGFDAVAAKKTAQSKSTKPAEQLELFESLKKRYLAQHSGIAARGSASFSYDYDTTSKTAFVNLSPMNANCANVGFEQMSWNNWAGGTYSNTTITPWGFAIPWVNGVVSLGNNTYPQAFDPVIPASTMYYPNRHTIMTIPPGINNPPFNCTGWDSIAINPTTHLSDIPFVPSTSNGVSARLGNANNNFNETERLVYSLAVTPANANFTISYAVIIYDGGHGLNEQPFFKITTRDQNGNIIPGCGQYQIDATQVASDTSFKSASYWDVSANSWYDPVPGATSTYLYYKKWTTVGLNLSSYIGSTVTIEFQTGDCIFGGHWCYAYVDASCQPAQVTVNMCTGSTNAVLAAPPGYSVYQWYGPNGMTIIPGATNDSLYISNATAGDIYTVALINVAGCTTSIQTTLASTSIAIQSTLSTPSCAAGSSGTAVVVPQGSNNGYSYSWVNLSTGLPVSGNTGNLTGLSPGTYSVVISSPGCGSADTTIIVGIAPPVYYSMTQNFCNVPAILQATSGGSNYTWYDPNGSLISGANQSVLSISNPVNGSVYTVVYPAANSCVDSVKITLTQNVNVLTQNINYCGTSATLNAPPGATNIVWYDYNNWPPVIIGNSNSITITNPVNWYCLVYNNATTNCKDSIVAFLINVPGDISYSNLSSTCAGVCTGAVTLNITAGNPAFVALTVNGPGGYSYSNPSAGTSQSLNNLCAGSYTASYTDGQCTATTTFVIDSIMVNASVTANDTICSGSNAIATFTYSGGSLPGNYTYSWNPSIGVSGTPPIVSLTPTVSTNYIVTITSIVGACVKQDTVSVAVINPFTLIMPPSVSYCSSTVSDTIIASAQPVVSSGVWSGSGMTDMGNDAGGIFNPATAGTGNHYVYFTASSANCTVKDSVLLIVLNIPAATFTNPGPFCITDNAVNIVTLNSGGVFNGPGITNSGTGTFSPSAAGAGTWPVEYVLAGVCPDSSTQNIIVYPQPILAVSSDIIEGCEDLEVSFSSVALPAPANGSVQWFFGDASTGNQMNMTHIYSDSGYFNVTYIYKDLNGCSDTVTNINMIHVFPAAHASFTASPNPTSIIDPTVHFTNLSTGASSYLWEFEPDSTLMDVNPVWNYTTDGTYTVTLIAYSQNGCNDTVAQMVIINQDVVAYVPNAFTPGDKNHLNDVFIPLLSGIDISSYKMEIYDRWGEKIFETTDVNKGWDGKTKGHEEIVQMEVYVWKIYFDDIRGKGYTKTGHVTMVK